MSVIKDSLTKFQIALTGQSDSSMIPRNSNSGAEQANNSPIIRKSVKTKENQGFADKQNNKNNNIASNGTDEIEPRISSLEAQMESLDTKFDLISRKIDVLVAR